MTNKQIEEAAKEYSKGKSSSPVFQESHINDFTAGVEWALSQKEEPTKGVEERLEKLRANVDLMDLNTKSNQHSNSVINIAELKNNILKRHKKILKEKFDCYGQTLAAINFAFNETINEFLPHLSISNTQSEAVEFAEWLEIKAWVYNPIHKEWFNQVLQPFKTTAELYTEFQKSKLK